MSANLNNPAAIPPKSVRAERGRYIAEAQAGAVGAWDWNPTPVAETPAATLIPIKNTGGTAAVAFEALVVTESGFGAALDDCHTAYGTGCTHGESCTLGTCSTWPADYGEVHAAAQRFPPSLLGTTTNAAPTPGNLRQWVVAAEPIAAGETGMAYSGGMFYAMVWDPDGYLGECEGATFVDLPQNLTGYDAATDSDPQANLPLRVRGNGRGRILWYDENVTVGGNPWPFKGTARLALIERTQLFTYPSLWVTITDATELSAWKWAYDWEATHNTDCDHDIVGTALNLCESANTASNINGIPVAQLNSCFGAGCWELQDLAAHGGQVLLTLAMASDGSIQPVCNVMNQIIEQSC